MASESRPGPPLLADALALVPRIHERDHHVWGPDPTELADRLGWLDAVTRADVPRWRAVVEDVVGAGIRDVLLVGMGGSSLYPQVLAEIAGDPRVRLTVLDSTDPAAVLAVEDDLDWAHTLLVVASKSGTTVEPLAHLDRFAARLHAVHGEDAPRYVIAVTDPGSSLERRASSEGFRAVVHGEPDVGGRYSALTAFGLFPGLLLGLDVEAHLAGARAELAACRSQDPAINEAAVLAARLAAAVRTGLCELELRMDDEVAALGPWIEQLVAESLGKQGVGVLPLLGPTPPATSPQRVVVAVGGEADPDPEVVWFGAQGLEDLGRLVVRFEFATALAGALIGVNPFDQPDVAAAKEATGRALEAGAELPAPQDPAALLDDLGAARAVVLLAFVPPAGQAERDVREVAERIAERTGVPVTVGIGPRYLHSTGQLHKGGPDPGPFLIVVGEDPRDAEIPGRGYGFARLKRAQAAGDLAALEAAGRRVARTSLEALRGW